MSRTKRRASSKTKRSGFPWGRLVLGFVAFLVIGGLLAVFAAKSWLQSYLRSPELAEKISLKLGRVLKAEPELARPEWAGETVFFKSFSAVGSEGAFFSTLDLESIRAQIDLGSIRDRVLGLPALQADRAELRISDARGGTAPPPAPAPTGLAARFSPQKFEFDEARIESLNFDYDRKGTKVRIVETKAILIPMLEAGAVDLEGTGGTLHLTGLPPMEITYLKLRVRRDGLYIQHAELTGGGDSLVEGDGEILFGSKARGNQGTKGTKGRYETTISVTDLDVDRLVSESWKGRVKGLAEAEIESEAVFAQGARPRHSGEFSVVGAQVKDLPVLRTLADHTRDDRFLELDFSKVEGNFTRRGEKLELRNLDLQEDSLLRMTGDADIEGGQIDGTFQVGVARGALRWIPGAERKVFTEERGGFVWTTVRLTGPLATPREDLSLRLKQGAVEAVVEDTAGAAIDSAAHVAGKGTSVLDDAGSRMLGAGGGSDVSEAAGSVIESGAGAAKEAAKGVGGILSDFVPILPGG